MSTVPSELAGMRLGALERTLLVNAPPLGTLGGLCIRAPEGTRSAQQAYLRASKKLAVAGLIHRKRVRQPTRASDPRRQHPVYRDGAFWHRRERTRAHRVARVFVWVTPFGAGIRMAYANELMSGRPIRWTRPKTEAARRYAAADWKDPVDQEVAERLLEERLGEASDSADARQDV